MPVAGVSAAATETPISEPIGRRHVRASPRVLLAILVTTLLWASAFVAIRSARTHFAPAPLALGRLLVGCVALSALMVARRLPLPPRRELPAIVACGVLWFGIYNIALNQGERLIDAGTAAMVVNVAPIMIALLAALVLRERLSRWLLGGLAVAFAGAAVIGVASSSHHHGGLGGVAAVRARSGRVQRRRGDREAGPRAGLAGGRDLGRVRGGRRRVPAVRAGAGR